jgi:hypothetical protein
MTDKLKRHIKTSIQYANPFGDVCVLKIPEDCDMIVLAVNKGFGLKPISVRLPHQVYVEDLEKMIKEHHAHEVVAIPFNHKNYISIVGNVGDSKENANAWTA